jgi:cytochrome bd-type quinol oxidase subunit 2
MPEPSPARKVLVVAGFLVSLSGASWFLSLPNKPDEIIPRIGFICAGLCALGCTAFCWAAVYAYVVRKLNRSPKFCRWAALPFAVAGFLLFFAQNQHWWSLSSVLLSQASLTAYICRKIAFPELTDEQASEPVPPINLFSR